ncbi:NAD synthetase [Metamycoplasma hyosynoviae]|uniref:NAD(+) synthase n=1 Tax=Metamycoplasma hyosynoviae TaxID=29559 RepID=UPI0004614133|nr:NAD(+) synthase [Metamycoplasma hyosynoviae]KDE42732.1 NAD synthetase [Metamycoplasma hyosynoviae]
MYYKIFEKFKQSGILSPKEYKIYSILIKKIKTWLRQKVLASKTSGITLGLSGGIDSTVLALIAYEEFKDDAHFYYFKTKTDRKTENDIVKLQQYFNNSIITIDLTENFNALTKTLKVTQVPIKSNIKSRLFMTSLYALSQKHNTLVIGTDNFAEYYLGYFTKYGDGGVDLLPLANLQKSDIFVLGTLLDIPKTILEKKPTANLCTATPDEDSLGFSYDEFERWLIDEHLIDPEKSKRIKVLHKASLHKVSLIPKGPKLK